MLFLYHPYQLQKFQLQPIVVKVVQLVLVSLSLNIIHNTRKHLIKICMQSLILSAVYQPLSCICVDAELPCTEP